MIFPWWTRNGFLTWFFPSVIFVVVPFTCLVHVCDFAVDVREELFYSRLSGEVHSIAGSACRHRVIAGCHASRGAPRNCRIATHVHERFLHLTAFLVIGSFVFQATDKKE